MKLYSLFSLLLYSGILFAQSEFIKQITNYNFDSRNPSVLDGSPFGNEGEFVFEIHDGNNINIGLIKYSADTDSFTAPVKITNNSFQNINPSDMNYYDGKHIVVFQTNQNGNQDIAISEEQGGNWSNPIFLTSSNEDETNPSFVLNSYNEPFDTLWVLYEKSNSIHLVSFKDSITADRIIFGANDSISYSSATGMMYGGINVAAVKYSPSEQKIVYVFFDNVNGTFSSVETINDDGICSLPKVFPSVISRGILTYESKSDTGYQNVFYLDNWPDASSPTPWVDNPQGDISSLSVAPIDYITKNENGNGDPCSYLVTRNDSTYINLNNNENFYNQDTLVYTRVNIANLDKGFMGAIPSYFIYYTIFEDSSNGHINLFGRKQSILIGSIAEDNIDAPQFKLMQNYPNPFNSQTRIFYALSQQNFVNLKVYDLLGNEAAELVNETKVPGVYSIYFNAEKFSSGVYFYKLTVGDNTKTKKMILIK
jgi:Secretion system C-terminal sorting domain